MCLPAGNFAFGDEFNNNSASFESPLKNASSLANLLASIVSCPGNFNLHFTHALGGFEENPSDHKCLIVHSIIVDH